MRPGRRPRAAVIASLLAAAAAFGGPAFAETKFKVVLDTGPNHIRNITVRAFLDRFKAATNGEYVGELYESGALMASSAEPKAIARGDIAMAVPTTSVLSNYETNFSIIELPMFSGLSPKVSTQIVDGELGKALNALAAKRLDLVVPGRWLLLGFADTFSTKKPIKSFEDMKGMKIRVPGGAASVAHYQALGANPIAMPFADVPLALSQGTIDALLTTNETIRSGKLVEAGVRNGFVDHVTALWYVPIVSKQFWHRLSPAHQKAFEESWEALIDGEREEALKRQESAREENQKAGIAYVEPSPAELEASRKLLMTTQDATIAALKIDPELARVAAAAIQQAAGK
jgi:TRAP-type C4-dicarboxylate transport system substrate-binding protein